MIPIRTARAASGKSISTSVMALIGCRVFIVIVLLVQGTVKAFPVVLPTFGDESNELSVVNNFGTCRIVY